MQKKIQVVVIGILKKDNKYLLTKRVHENKIFHDKWQFPGGGLEFNESIEKCLIREIEEELGIELKEYTYIPKYFETIRDNWHGVFAVFLCQSPSENLNIIPDLRNNFIN